MAETKPGGLYLGVDGKYHDANGKPLSIEPAAVVTTETAAPAEAVTVEPEAAPEPAAAEPTSKPKGNKKQ